jgi:hypothetical protein
MAHAPSGTNFARFVRSLFSIGSSKGPKLRTLPVLISHGIFSSMPALEVTSPGISRSRRQLAGLRPKACLKSLHRCA